MPKSRKAGVALSTHVGNVRSVSETQEAVPKTTVKVVVNEDEPGFWVVYREGKKLEKGWVMSEDEVSVVDLTCV
jgi:hypothetical protein